MFPNARRSSEGDQSRLTAAILWRHAREYAGAARLVHSHLKSHEVSLPVYFLLGRAIELALKAYLRAHGVTKDDLRNRFGHRLKVLLKAAKSRGLLKDVSLSDTEQAQIRMLDRHYSRKALEYVEVGTMRGLPEIHGTIILVQKLVSGVEPVALRASGYLPKKHQMPNSPD